MLDVRLVLSACVIVLAGAFPCPAGILAADAARDARADHEGGEVVAPVQPLSGWVCKTDRDSLDNSEFTTCELSTRRALDAARARGNRDAIAAACESKVTVDVATALPSERGLLSEACDFVELDDWLYNVERVLQSLRGSRSVLLLLDPVTAEPRASAAGALLQLTQHLCSMPWSETSQSTIVAVSTDQTNPFVRLRSYFGLDAAPGQWAAYLLQPRSTGWPVGRASFLAEIPSPSRLLPFRVREVPVLEASVGRSPLQTVPMGKEVSLGRTAPTDLRCADGLLRVFVYPDEHDGTTSEQYAAILRAIRESTFYTPHASQACLFVPGFDPTPLGPVKGGMGAFDPEVMESRLRKLAYWNVTFSGEVRDIPGSQHVMFDLTDSRSPYLRDIGGASLWKSGADIWHLRPRVDISFPAFPMHVNTNATARHSLLRQVLLSFQGTVWKPHLGSVGLDVRHRLLSLDNGRDIVMISPNTTDDRRSPRYYLDLLLRSRFAVVPRGGGLHSFRFVEVLAAGAIPVVMSDYWVIPFSEVVNPDSYCIRVKESEWHLLPHVVRSVPAARAEQLSRNAAYVFERYFRFPLATALDIVARRELQAFSNRQSAPTE